jgi:hypothetical protein
MERALSRSGRLRVSVATLSEIASSRCCSIGQFRLSGHVAAVFQVLVQQTIGRPISRLLSPSGKHGRRSARQELQAGGATSLRAIAAGLEERGIPCGSGLQMVCGAGDVVVGGRSPFRRCKRGCRVRRAPKTRRARCNVRSRRKLT